MISCHKLFLVPRSLLRQRLINVSQLELFLAGTGARVLSTTSSTQSVMKEQLATWKKAHELFNNPERDVVNFPREGYQDFEPPTRLGFVPTSIFQSFYEKTGVTGPYFFGAGLLTYLFSKEIWVANHHFAHFISFWLVLYLIQRYGSSTIKSWVDPPLDARDDAMYYKPVRDAKAAVQEHIKDVTTVIKQNETKLMVTDIKQENVDLQLEAIYRQRLQQVYQDVKKRLDYQIELQSTRHRFERDHMVNWIVNSVLKNITPQHEKDSVKESIQRLKELSKTSAATV